MPRLLCQSRATRLTARLAAIAAIAALSAPGTSVAADLVVKVSGMVEPFGQVGCALFASPDGFPLDTAKARMQWLPGDAKGVSCKFTGVSAGRYAISVGHDLNGNKRVDMNFVGMPTEQWGVSRGARPALRAPHFDEAVFEVTAGATELVIDIKVAK